MTFRLQSRGPRHEQDRRDDNPCPGEAGFTVARLLVSFSIVATMLATAAPNFYQTLQVYTIRGAARRIYSDLQSARMAAVMENNRHRVSITGVHSWEIRDDEDRDEVFEDAEVIATRDITADSPGVSVTSSGEVIFTASGTALTATTITVTDVRGGNMTVSVSPAGRIRIL